MKSNNMSDEQQQRILAMTPLRELLPHTFENGSVVDGISCQCSKCSKEIDADNIKGEIEFANSHSISLSAYGLCYDCRMATPIILKFADDGSYLANGPTGWMSGRYADDKPAGWLRWLRSLSSPGGPR